MVPDVAFLVVLFGLGEAFEFAEFWHEDVHCADFVEFFEGAAGVLAHNHFIELVPDALS